MIFENQSERDYNALEGARSTILSLIDRKTLAHAKAAIDGKMVASSGALSFGQAAHDAILRPQEFVKKWGILPEGHNGTTKDGKEAKAKLAASYGDSILKHDDALILRLLQTSLESHPSIKPLLNGITKTELSLQWVEQGITCKARIDAVTEVKGVTLLLDLKTSRSAEQRDFERSCVNYGYLIQSAHYLAGAKACGLIKQDNNNFLHVVVEKEAPYLSAVYCLDAASLELGEKRRQESLRKYASAMSSGIWPGYSEQIETIAAPHWYFENSSDFADGI